MKWTLTLILTLYCLQAPVSHAQTKDDPLQNSAPAVAPEKTNVSTVNVSEEPIEKAAEESANAMPPIDSSHKDVSFNDRSIKIAKKANYWSKYQTIINGIGLILLFLTTGFAWGAWRASKQAVKVGKIDAMPNLHIKGFKHSAIIFEEAGIMRAYQMKDKVICSTNFIVENKGRTVAKNVKVEMTARIRANDPSEIIEVVSVSGFATKIITEPAPSESNTQILFDIPAYDEVPVRQGFYVPFGETIKFQDVTVTGFHIYRIEIDVVLKYLTAFGDCVTINQSFGIRALQKDGSVERITRVQEEI